MVNSIPQNLIILFKYHGLYNIELFSSLTFHHPPHPLPLSFLTTIQTHLLFAERREKCYYHFCKDFGPLLFSLNNVNAEIILA